MTGTIPSWSYLDEYAALREQVLAACDRVFKSGRLILGEEGKAFEAELAASAGVRGGVGVNSGTDAIVIALGALGVGAGDEVITVPNTAVPSVSAIVTAGATPVFVDVGEDCLIDVGKLEAAITPRTKAIMPVHLYGQMADMDPLMEIARRHAIPVVEDAAQAQGATYKGRIAGSIGAAATFSFYPTKILGGYGDGGAILSNDEAVLAAARSLRFYGMETVYYAERHGYNSRLDELQAAILRVKLPLVEEWIARRRAIAARYDAALAGHSRFRPVGENAHNRHVYHLYVIEASDRERLMAKLGEADIGTGISYKWPIHIMRGYAHLGYAQGDFPVAERKAELIMNLPIFPQLGDDQVERVIETVLANG
jgi:aminotransferase EvaB